MRLKSIVENLLVYHIPYRVDREVRMDDCHEKWSSMSNLKGTEQYSCLGQCRSKQDAEKTCVLEVQGTMLIVNLVRAIDFSPGAKKTKQPVIFERYWEPQGLHRWELCSVLVHKGDVVNSGHYICFVRHGANWFLTSDSTVKRVSQRHVFAEYNYANAYVLMYTR